MKLNEFSKKTLELFESFECRDDTSYGCSSCPMNVDGGCLHLDVKRKIQLWVINNG